MRILVVEDEQKLAKALKEGLQADQYTVEIAHTGEEGFYLVETQSFDVVVLDVMLPGRSGIEILAAMRQRGYQNAGSHVDCQRYDSGSRPWPRYRRRRLFGQALRLPGTPGPYPGTVSQRTPDVGPRLRVADLEMDVVGRLATRGGQALELTPREFDLLEYLVRHQGTLSRAKCWLAMSGERWVAIRLSTT